VYFYFLPDFYQGLEASIDPELEVRRPALKLRQSTVNVHRYDQKSTSTSVNPSDSIPEETIDEVKFLSFGRDLQELWFFKHLYSVIKEDQKSCA